MTTFTGIERDSVLIDTINSFSLILFSSLKRMATITSDNEYDSSRAGQGSTSAQDGGYGEHQNNGQGKHRTALAMPICRLPIGYSQGGGSAGSGAKPEDERKLFVGKIPPRRRRIRCLLYFDS